MSIGIEMSDGPKESMSDEPEEQPAASHRLQRQDGAADAGDADGGGGGVAYGATRARRAYGHCALCDVVRARRAWYSVYLF